MNYTFNSLQHEFTVKEVLHEAHFDVEFNVRPNGDIELIDHTMIYTTDTELLAEAHSSFLLAFDVGSFNGTLMETALDWGYELDEETPSPY